MVIFVASISKQTFILQKYEVNFQCKHQWVLGYVLNKSNEPVNQFCAFPVVTGVNNCLVIYGFKICRYANKVTFWTSNHSIFDLSKQIDCSDRTIRKIEVVLRSTILGYYFSFQWAYYCNAVVPHMLFLKTRNSSDIHDSPLHFASSA